MRRTLVSLLPVGLMACMLSTASVARGQDDEIETDTSRIPPSEDGGGIDIGDVIRNLIPPSVSEPDDDRYVPPRTFPPMRVYPPNTGIQPGNLYPPGNTYPPGNAFPPANTRPSNSPGGIRPNAPPPKPAASLAQNPAPASKQAPADQLALLGNLAQQDANQAIDDIQQWLDLAGVKNDPGVQAQLNKLKDKIRKGQRVTVADSQALISAIANAKGGNPQILADPKFQQFINKKLGQLQSASLILAALLLPPGGVPLAGMGWPVGPGIVIYDPFLPAGQWYILPNGAVIVGTGGIGVVVGIFGPIGPIIGVPIVSGNPWPTVPNLDPQPLAGGVLLKNPTSNQVMINYSLGRRGSGTRRNYQMKAGYTQKLGAGSPWVIQFDRGGNHGTAKYSLLGGTYYFVGTDNGWDLRRMRFELTIDNAGNPNAFHYIADDKNYTVAAGQANTHKSEFPIPIRFDRGGGKEARKLADRAKTTLRVAVNPNDNLWDLYPEDAVSVSNRPPVPTAVPNSQAPWPQP